MGWTLGLHGRSAAAALVLAAVLVGSSLAGVGPGLAGERPPTSLALVNATLIDGTGAPPTHDVVVVVDGDRIAAVGPASEVVIPYRATVVDLRGGTIMPGFVDAHVHRGFDGANLEAWAQSGVTTVRDEGAAADRIEGLRAFRAENSRNPRQARLVSAGTMIGAYGGYGSKPVNTPDQARRAVLAEIGDGVDEIKLALEDGYSGTGQLPNLTADELAAIVETAHAHGLRVSGHVTAGAHVGSLLAAGVDDLAHIPCDQIPWLALGRLVGSGTYAIPTFSFFRNIGAPMQGCVDNLRRILQLGGKVALGNDYGGDPGPYELGMPMFEIEKMAEAGMTPMQIIVAATRNGAEVVGLAGDVGTVEPGKLADLLVVAGDPLADLSALGRPSLVVHAGAVIRDELGG